MTHTDVRQTLLVMGIHEHTVPYLFANAGHTLCNKDGDTIHGEVTNDLKLLQNPGGEHYMDAWEKVKKEVCVLIDNEVYFIHSPYDVWGINMNDYNKLNHSEKDLFEKMEFKL